MDEWSRPGELDVFATGDTSILAPPSEAAPSTIGLVVRKGGQAVLDLHAAPGHRPGTPIATTSGRRSGPTDIVRPVLIDPRRAAALAEHDLFAEPVAGLVIDHREASTEHPYLVWNGQLSGTHLSPVPVALHLLASPSMVVTVLELVPQTKVRWHQRTFIRAGVRATDALANRLIRLHAESPCVRSAE